MTAGVQQLLDAFDALPEEDKHRAAVEILRRLGSGAEGDLPEQTLVEAADELFCVMDRDEANRAHR